MMKSKEVTAFILTAIFLGQSGLYAQPMAEKPLYQVTVVQSAASFIGRFQTGSFLNYSGYSNPEVDRLIALAERQNDPAQRARYYLEAERLLLQDYPVIPLFSSMTHCLVAARVRGWAANSGLSLPSRYLSVS